MDFEEIFEGYFFDITHETNPEEIADVSAHIISKGIGRHTEFINPPK